MSESTVISIIGWVVGFLSLGVTALIGFMFRHSNRLSGVEGDVKWLVKLFDQLGKKSGRVLHSPHTPELDKLIEKYEREELLWHEVGKFAHMLKEIENNSRSAKGDKLAAGIILLSLERTYGNISELVQK